MIAEPPSAGGDQSIKTLLPEMMVTGAAGVEGTVAGITAPLPAGDAAELPIALVAIIRAKTLDPTARLYGAAFKSEMAIVQDVAVQIQPVYAVYVVPSLSRISTVYLVIAEPPSAGASQAI